VNDELLPLSFDPVSNGEYLPPPKSERDHAAEKRIHRIAEKNAARTGVSRRTFLAGGVRHGGVAIGDQRRLRRARRPVPDRA
jgi:hypothetical protein